MRYNKQYLHEKYNATSTDDGKGDIETYENWLEKQLISRLETIEKKDKEIKQLEESIAREIYYCTSCMAMFEEECCCDDEE